MARSNRQRGKPTARGGAPPNPLGRDLPDLQLGSACAVRFGPDEVAISPVDRERSPRGAGFPCGLPEGAYYLMLDVSSMLRAGESDVDFAMRLVEEAGVATVPGSSFYGDPADGARFVRFCYAKKLETLEEAGRRLKAWAERG